MTVSSFYSLLSEAREFSLSFPVGEQGDGPSWDESGRLDLREVDTTESEPVTAVWLGEDRYRLAEKTLGPFSSLRLNWGDEFIAECTGGDHLLLRAVVTPMRFQHYSLFTSPGFNNEHPLAKIVHQHGGGWETVTGGILNLTLPVTEADAFHRSLDNAGPIPGIFQIGEAPSWP